MPPEPPFEPRRTPDLTLRGLLGIQLIAGAVLLFVVAWAAREPAASPSRTRVLRVRTVPAILAGIIAGNHLGGTKGRMRLVPIVDVCVSVNAYTRQREKVF